MPQVAMPPAVKTWVVGETFFNEERKFVGIDFSSPINQISQSEFKQLISDEDLLITVDGLKLTTEHISWSTIPDPELVETNDDDSHEIQDIDYGFDQIKQSYFLDIIGDANLADLLDGEQIDPSAFVVENVGVSVTSAEAKQSYSNLGIRLYLSDMLPEFNSTISPDLSISYDGSLDLNFYEEEDYLGQPIDDLDKERIEAFNVPIPGFNQSSLAYLSDSLEELEEKDIIGWMDIQLNDTVEWDSGSIVE